MFPYRQSVYTYNITFSQQVPFPGSYIVQAENPQLALVPQLAVVPQQQVVQRRQTRVHYTGYDRNLTDSQFCRCAQPETHGDAYSHPEVNNHAQYDGIHILDLQGQEIPKEEYLQRCMDILGKDFVNSKYEIRAVRAQVMHPDSIRATDGQRETARRAAKTGEVRVGLPHDLIWHGPVNPKGCHIHPPPEQCEHNFIGASGSWDPVTGRAVNGLTMIGRDADWGQRGYGSQGFSRRRYY